MAVDRPRQRAHEILRIKRWF